MEKLRQEREIRKKNFQKQKAEAAQALAAKGLSSQSCQGQGAGQRFSQKEAAEKIWRWA